MNRLIQNPCTVLLCVLLAVLPVSGVSAGRDIGETQLTLSRSIAGANSNVTVLLTLQQALPVGSVISVHQHWQDPQRLQIETPAAPAHVTIPGLRSGYEKVDGVHGGLNSLVAVPSFEVLEQSMPAGTELRITVKDLALPAIADYAFTLPIYVRRPDMPALLVPGNSVTLTSGALSKLALRASSIVRPDQPVDVWLRLEDTFGNLAGAQSLTLDLLVNGTFSQRVNVTESVSQIEGVSFQRPGVYQLEVRSGGGGLRTLSNPILVETSTRQVLWAALLETSNLSTGYLDPATLEAAHEGIADVFLPADGERYLPGPPELSPEGVSVRKQQEKNSSRVTLTTDGDTLTEFGLAELPTDLRNSVSRHLKQVQVVAGGGHYLWLLHRALDQGYPVGIFGTNYSEQYPRKQPPVYTGLLLNGGETWREAVADGRSFVSVGRRIVMLPNHTRLEMTAAREIVVDIIAGESIDSIQLVKNGEIIDEANGAPVEGLFNLALHSPSQPFSNLLSRPRNGREWLGYVATRDASLNVEAVDSQWATRRQPDGQRIDFLTRTHGDRADLSFSLTQWDLDTLIEVGIAQGFEDAAWLPVDRLPQETPKARFLVTLAEIENDAVRLVTTAGYQDVVTLTQKTAPMPGQFQYRFEDSEPPRIGDYYYLVVRLVDGAIGYSTPMIVGHGESPSRYQ